MGVSVIWLVKRRQQGNGPPYEKISARCLRYRLSAVRRWLDEREFKSIAAYKAHKRAATRRVEVLA